jgi:hypothetical protein
MVPDGRLSCISLFFIFFGVALPLARAATGTLNTVSPPIPQVPSAITPPPQIPDYTLVFDDEFDRLDLSPDGTGSHNWYPGVWYWGPNSGPQANISVSNSTLSLVWSPGVNPTPPANTSISTFAQNNPNYHAWRYGYFEARMKCDIVTGAWPAIWMIPVQQSTQGATDTGELDLWEAQGNTPTTFYGTLHEWQGASPLWSSSPNSWTLPPGTDFSQYHTIGLWWVPGHVTWYFDNQPVLDSPTTAIFDQQDYFLILAMQEGVNWTYGNTTGVTVSSMTMKVDWVHVWQATASAPPPIISTPPLLSTLEVYPNPWRSDKHAPSGMTFDRLTAGTDIKIFAVSGHEVKELRTDGPKIVWDLTNDSGDKVASGIYLYLITDNQGDKLKGKLAVIK